MNTFVNVPKFTSVRNLENNVLHKQPTFDVCWWITLQTAESIINKSCETDSLNNVILDQFVNDISINLKDVFLDAAKPETVRPYPYTNLMKLITYCEKNLKNVIKSPNYATIKVDTMVLVHKNKCSTKKTMRWLSRQPGHNVKEKLGSSKKILSQKKVVTFEKPENEVLVYVIKELLSKVNEIYEDGYDKNSKSQEIANLKHLKKLFDKSDLKDVSKAQLVSPNNQLISDTNYRILWKTYLLLKKFNLKMAYNWEHCFELYIISAYIYLIGKLAENQNIQVFEKRLNIQNLLDFDYSNSDVEFIIGEAAPVKLTATLNDKEINLKFEPVKLNGKYINKNEAKNYKIDFKNIDYKKTKAKHGISFSLSINGKSQKTTCDYAGYNLLFDSVKNIIENNFSINLKTFQIGKITKTVDCSMSFSMSCGAPLCSINGNFADFNLANKTIRYKESLVDYIPVDKNFYFNYDNVESVCYLNDSFKSAEPKTQALQNFLGEISQNVSLGYEDSFLYIVPDYLEEFLQNTLKLCVSSWFKKSFPVWRSVASFSSLLTEVGIPFKQGDYILYIDLANNLATTGLLAVNHEKRINNFICTHTPPFKQDELGDYITEKFIFKTYLEKFLNKYNLILDESNQIELLNSDKFKNMFLDEQGFNQTFKINGEVEIIFIDFEEEILKETLTIWLNKFNEFWRSVRKNIDKLNVSSINYINILSNILEVYFDLLVDLDKKNHNFLASNEVIFSNDMDILSGSELYKKRLKRNLPTWLEHLPKLRLEVIYDGHHQQLDLVNDNIKYDIMDTNNSCMVKETLILNANQEEYRFPLTKDNITNDPTKFDAYITDKSFPLKYSEEVELKVNYKYGLNNSFELILIPKNKNAPFEEIVVKWERQKNIVFDKIYPKYDFKPLSSKEIIGESGLFSIYSQRGRRGRIRYGKLKELNEHFIKVERMLSSLYDDFNQGDFDNINTDVIQLLTVKTFQIRNIVSTYHILKDHSILQSSLVTELENFVNNFYCLDLIKTLINIAFSDEFTPKNANLSNNSNFTNENLLLLRTNCILLLTSFGKYTPDSIQELIIHKFDNIKTSKTYAYVEDILPNIAFLNYDNEKLNALIKKNVYKANSKSLDRYIIQYAVLFWFDTKLLFVFYEKFPHILELFIKKITKTLKAFETANPSNFNKKFFLRSTEMILAIMRLRELEDFNLLEPGSLGASNLSESIRIVDTHFGKVNSKIRFETTVPEALKNMNTVSYTVNLYLTGDAGANLIKVKSVSE